MSERKQVYFFGADSGGLTLERGEDHFVVYAHELDRLATATVNTIFKRGIDASREVKRLTSALALSEAEVKQLQERSSWFKRVFARLTRKTT